MKRMADAATIRRIVDRIKVTRGCEMCGYNTHPAALDFDHLDPATKYRTRNGTPVHLADMIKGGRYGLQTILVEIHKCRVLCANCHRAYTHNVQRKE